MPWLPFDSCLVVFLQAKDILDAILENYPKSKKDLYVSTPQKLF